MEDRRASCDDGAAPNLKVRRTSCPSRGARIGDQCLQFVLDLVVVNDGFASFTSAAAPATFGAAALVPKNPVGAVAIRGRAERRVRHGIKTVMSGLTPVVFGLIVGPRELYFSMVVGYLQHAAPTTSALGETAKSVRLPSLTMNCGAVARLPSTKRSNVGFVDAR